MNIKDVVLDMFRWHFKKDGIDESFLVKEYLGSTSIDEIEIVMGIEENLGESIEIPQSLVLRTVGDYIEYVSNFLDKKD